MKDYHISKHNSFYTIGLNYKKADAEARGKFSLDEVAVNSLLVEAKNQGIDGLLATSTCNRTELHGFAQHPFQLIKLLCDHSNGTVEAFQEVAYVGLDSQILGDFEIISQLKQSFKRSKELGIANPFIERLCNSIIQASKRIKNETEISSGATSVAFASVQYILRNVENVAEKNILLFGTGKIGRNTCENLIKHTKNPHITLINRTKGKAEQIAGKFNLMVKNYGDLQSEIRTSDILVVATGAQKPTITKELIYTNKPLLILDLSVPKNVDASISDMENVTVIHLDHLSQMTDETLERRKQFIPEAEAINEEVKNDFNQWLETRKFAPVIKALKKKLKTIKDEELDYQSKKTVDFNSHQADVVTNRIIQKITKQFANHLKDDTVDSNSSLEFIQKVFQLELDEK